jgi:hypothetical protein
MSGETSSEAHGHESEIRLWPISVSGLFAVVSDVAQVCWTILGVTSFRGTHVDGSVTLSDRQRANARACGDDKISTQKTHVLSVMILADENRVLASIPRSVVPRLCPDRPVMQITNDAK